MDKEILKQLCEAKGKFQALQTIYKVMPEGSKIEMAKEDMLAICNQILIMIDTCLVDEQVRQIND